MKKTAQSQLGEKGGVMRKNVADGEQRQENGDSNVSPWI